jgi:hypothetical protein
MVALDSRAACSQGLLLAGLATAAAVSGLQRCRNIRIDGHFSAHGMPNARSALHMTLCVQSYAAMTSVSCATSLRGTGCFGVFGPHPKPTAQDSDFRRNSIGPSAGGVWGMRRGQRRADRPENQRQPQGNKAAVQLPCRSASRRVRQGTEAVCPRRNILQCEIVQPHLFHLGFVETRSGCLSRSASFRSHARRHGHVNRPL